MLEIETVRVWFAEYPLARPFRISSGSLSSIPQIFISIHCKYGKEKIIGFGHNSYSLIWADHRHLSSLQKDREFRRYLKKSASRLKGIRLGSPFDFYRKFILQSKSELPDLVRLMALSPIDLALWDAWAKARKSPVFKLPIVQKYLDTKKPQIKSVMYLATIGYSLSDIKRDIRREDIHSFKVKLKGDPSWDSMRLNRISCIKGLVSITADANESYTDLKELNKFIDLLSKNTRKILRFVEQPFLRDSDFSVKNISKKIPIFADESYAFHSDIPKLYNLGYFGVSLKPHTKTFSGTLLALKELKKRKMRYSIMDLTTAPPIGYRVGILTAQYLRGETPPESNGKQFYRVWGVGREEFRNSKTLDGWGVLPEEFWKFKSL